jgi:maltoporin
LLIPVFLAQRNAGVELGASRMTTVSPIDRKRPPMWWLGYVALSLFWISPASAQQADPLEQQLKELKQEYEVTTQALQLRMATLEQQIESQKAAAEKTKEATVSAADLAVERAAAKAVLRNSDQVGAKFQGDLPSEPTYDLLREADETITKLKQQVGTFEFHGYFRSGYGLNSAGGQQVAFEAPGANAKYRLGNETETYGEFIFVNNWVNPEQSSNEAWMKTEIMIEANTTNSANSASFPNGVGNDQFRLREAFVQAGNVLGWQPHAEFWAGERYYRRQHIDIIDFYPLDLSGYGGGVEDVNVGIGKMAVAFLNGARPDIVTQNGNLAKSNIDVRLYDLKGPAGLWAVWFDYATSKGGTTSTGTAVPTTDGYAFGLRHQRLEWHDGYHTFSIQYGTGAASNFSNPGNGVTIPNPSQFTNQSAQFLVTEQLVVQPNEWFGIMPIFLYQRTKDGNPQDGWNQWASFGARPVIFFTKHVSLAFEAGFDHTDSGINQYDGWLRKFTLAPQIGAGRKFFSRPVLRVFVTYANWSDGYRGLVGGTPYSNRTNGLTYGVQTENWW